jgi:hypothetical protein
MDFIQDTNDWIEGEIFEAAIFGSFGLLTVVFSLVFWKFGETPNSKAVIIPLAVVGIFLLGTAISGIAANRSRLIQYKEAFQKDKTEFLLSEKKRVENFQYLNKMTVIIAAVCFSVAIGFFLFTNNYVLKGIGLALIILGLSGLVIDYFSEERAAIYYKAIMSEIESL